MSTSEAKSTQREILIPSMKKKKENFMKVYIKRNLFFFIIRNPKSEELKQKLRSGQPLDESLSAYKKHREKYQSRNQEAMKGFKDHLYTQGPRYDPLNEFYADNAWGDKYNKHNRDEVITDNPYWDTKENDAYYSLSKWKRLKLHLKEKTNINIPFNKEMIFLNLLIVLILIYYANKKSKQIIL